MHEPQSNKLGQEQIQKLLKRPTREVAKPIIEKTKAEPSPVEESSQSRPQPLVRQEPFSSYSRGKEFNEIRSELVDDIRLGCDVSGDWD